MPVHKYTGKGQCYRLAFEFLLKLDADDFVLVHGTWTNPDGLTIAHAWVEKTTSPIVIDVTSNPAFSKEEFYGQARAIKKYTMTEAAKLALRTRHFGPWDAESNRIGDEAERRAGL